MNNKYVYYKKKMFIRLLFRNGTLCPAGLEEIGEEEWLVFRNKIGKLDQFLENWNEKLQEHRDTHPLLKWLETEIGSYKVDNFF